MANLELSLSVAAAVTSAREDIAAKRYQDADLMLALLLAFLDVEQEPLAAKLSRVSPARITVTGPYSLTGGLETPEAVQ